MNASILRYKLFNGLFITNFQRSHLTSHKFAGLITYSHLTVSLCIRTVILSCTVFVIVTFFTFTLSNVIGSLFWVAIKYKSGYLYIAYQNLFISLCALGLDRDLCAHCLGNMGVGIDHQPNGYEDPAKQTAIRIFWRPQGKETRTSNS